MVDRGPPGVGGADLLLGMAPGGNGGDFVLRGELFGVDLGEAWWFYKVRLPNLLIILPGKKLPIKLNKNADESYTKRDGLGIQIVLNSLIFVLFGIARNCSELKC